MSIETLKLDLEGRTGRELLPSFFPIELLIALTRELGHVANRSMSCAEMREIHLMLSSYLRRLVEMHGAQALANFDTKHDEMTPVLLQELYVSLTDEIVSRLIGYNVSLTSLRYRFESILENVEVSL